VWVPLPMTDIPQRAMVVRTTLLIRRVLVHFR
jgi:hypothetical protein